MSGNHIAVIIVWWIIGVIGLAVATIFGERIGTDFLGIVFGVLWFLFYAWYYYRIRK